MLYCCDQCVYRICIHFFCNFYFHGSVYVSMLEWMIQKFLEKCKIHLLSCCVRVRLFHTKPLCQIEDVLFLFSCFVEYSACLVIFSSYLIRSFSDKFIMFHLIERAVSNDILPRCCTCSYLAFQRVYVCILLLVNNFIVARLYSWSVL